MAKVYIVILNYKRWQDVMDCLNSVFRSRYKNFAVVVVDRDVGNVHEHREDVNVEPIGHDAPRR